MTGKEVSRKRAAAAMEEDSVAEYLRSNPDFFVRHPELVEELTIRHESGEATSLIEYQVRSLREQNAQLRRKLQGLVNVARQNEGLAQKLYEFSLTIMEADDLGAVVRAIDEGLQKDFESDAINITLFMERVPKGAGGNVRAVSVDDESLEPFRDFLAEANTLCGRLQRKKLEQLFGARAERVQSAALIPLGENSEYGMLAIGSFDAERFNPGMDTSFLRLMGQLFSRAFSRYLPVHRDRHAQGGD